MEIVRRWYTMLPDLREVDPADDPAFADRHSASSSMRSMSFNFPAAIRRASQMAAMLRGAWSESRFEVERFLDAGAGS